MQPVRPVNPRQKEKFRQLFIDQLTTLYRSVHADIRDSMVRELFDDDEVRDEADESQGEQLRDLRVQLAEGDALRAQLMEEALRRIQRDEFGKCIACGNEIGVARLELVPWAPRCIDCQEAVEAEARMRPPTL